MLINVIIHLVANIEQTSMSNAKIQDSLFKPYKIDHDAVAEWMYQKIQKSSELPKDFKKLATKQKVVSFWRSLFNQAIDKKEAWYPEDRVQKKQSFRSKKFYVKAFLFFDLGFVHFTVSDNKEPDWAVTGGLLNFRTNREIEDIPLNTEKEIEPNVIEWFADTFVKVFGDIPELIQFCPKPNDVHHLALNILQSVLDEGAKQQRNEAIEFQYPLQECLFFEVTYCRFQYCLSLDLIKMQCEPEGFEPKFLGEHKFYLSSGRRPSRPVTG